MWLALVAAFAVLVTPLLVVEPVTVRSVSMSPTFRSGDHVLIDKVTGRAHSPHRRDVVALRVPGSKELVIKRVVAVGGDEVGIEDGVLVVDGQPIQESFVDMATVDSTYFGPVSVPRGAVFVLGDNRANSYDSRRFGPVPLNDIVGRVVLTLWRP